LVRISNSAFVIKARQSWILSDSSQLDQVVANLAINARDAIPGGDRLTISTRNAASPPDHASDSNARSENWVVLGIADSGLGIDEKTRAQIFEPFFTTRPDGKGTGLGLATVYGIVKQSRGHIHVDSQPGNGTRFELYFPALDPRAASSVTKSTEAAADSGSGATVLVANGEAALRHAVVQILRTSAYRVLEAHTPPNGSSWPDSMPANCTFS
jgi:two-component system, cell cycle sensor histidine kinase and response regulator CckA